MNNIYFNEVEAIENIKRMEDFNPHTLRVILRYAENHFPEDIVFRTSEGARWSLNTLRESTPNQMVGAFHSPFAVVQALEKASSSSKTSSATILVAPGTVAAAKVV